MLSQNGNQFSLAAVGDMLITRRISVFKEERFLSMIDLLRNADVTFGQLETTIGTEDGITGIPGYWGTGIRPNVWVLSKPWVLDDLKWAGFDLINCANNHADF